MTYYIIKTDGGTGVPNITINPSEQVIGFATRLYTTCLGREPDPSGFADWVGQLNNGASRESVFQGFAQSQEWAGICAEYGILK